MLPFFEKWKWRCAAEVELKLDARDGRYKVIEINPRFPGYLRFAWQCGLDLPMLAARIALGDEHAIADALPRYRVGATYVAPTLFLRTVCRRRSRARAGARSPACESRSARLGTGRCRHAGRSAAVTCAHGHPEEPAAGWRRCVACLAAEINIGEFHRLAK